MPKILKINSNGKTGATLNFAFQFSEMQNFIEIVSVADTIRRFLLSKTMMKIFPE